jgi:hypothetical protein
MKIIDAEDADDFENVVQIPTMGRNDSEEAVSVHQFIHRRSKSGEICYVVFH